MSERFCMCKKSERFRSSGRQPPLNLNCNSLRDFMPLQGFQLKACSKSWNLNLGIAKMGLPSQPNFGTLVDLTTKICKRSKYFFYPSKDLKGLMRNVYTQFIHCHYKTGAKVKKIFSKFSFFTKHLVTQRFSDCKKRRRLF